MGAPDRRGGSVAERVLFGHPRFYRLKFFLIETVIWRWIFAGIFRRRVNPVPVIDDLIRGKHVLLAACGPGDVSTGPALDAAAAVTAFDLSEEFVLACRRRRPTWDVFQGNILAIARPDKSHDLAALYSSLHHIPAEAERVLAELARVTRERIVILEGVLPETGLLRGALRVWYRAFDGGLRYYTQRELLAAAERLGLVVERVSVHGPIGHMLLAVLAVPPTAATGPSQDR